MHVSGILIVTRPEETELCACDVEQLRGVEVHYCYPDRGRLIAVLETQSLESQQEGLREIQALPRVQMAALVEHRIEDDPAEPTDDRERIPL